MSENIEQPKIEEPIKENKQEVKLGRPKIEIDWEEFDKLCALQCTLIEIAEWFDCSDDTIENRVKEEKGMLFSEYYKKKSSRGKSSLRRKQYEVALKGNVSMLIWLGKQVLGQTDKQENFNIESGDTNKRLIIEFPKDEE